MLSGGDKFDRLEVGCFFFILSADGFRFALVTLTLYLKFEAESFVLDSRLPKCGALNNSNVPYSQPLPFGGLILSSSARAPKSSCKTIAVAGEAG